jgi:NTP pyrophosphatase (non-canonical NTP hydrolase)
MNYNQLTSEAYRIAVAKGFWNSVMSHEHYITLVICEVCKAIEAHRKQKVANTSAYRECLKADDIKEGDMEYYITQSYQEHIKGSVEEEFADTMIQLFSFSGYLEIDFDRMAPCRYFRAFHRFSFTENALALIKGLGRDQIVIEKRVQFALDYMRGWGESMGIDLTFHINEKLKYTEYAVGLTENVY